tara:strand:+ start:277 stop:672 length:396 start_codon:yes stop_codon:yes gene_type:complete
MKKIASKSGSQLILKDDGKYTLKVSKKEWESVGKQAGWRDEDKQAQTEGQSIREKEQFYGQWIEDTGKGLKEGSLTPLGVSNTLPYLLMKVREDLMKKEVEDPHEGPDPDESVDRSWDFRKEEEPHRGPVG